MAAGRPAAYIEPRRIASQRREILMKPTQRSPRLADNAVHLNLGRQGVARDRDMETMGKRSFGDEAEALFSIALPITAVEEQRRRRAGAVRREEIEFRAWRIASLSATAAELLYAASSACRSIEP